MRDLAKESSCDKVGEDYINYYLTLYTDVYLYFTSSFCHNCKDITYLLENQSSDKSYLKLIIDDNNTDDYMEYLEKNISCVKVPTLLYINNNGNIKKMYRRKFV